MNETSMVKPKQAEVLVPIDEYVDVLVNYGYAELQREGTPSRDTWEARLCEEGAENDMCWPYSLINATYEWTRWVR